MNIEILNGPLHNDPDGQVCPLEGCAKGLFRIDFYRVLSRDRIVRVGSMLLCELHPDTTYDLELKPLLVTTPAAALEGTR